MNIEQEIRAQIEKNKGLKLAVGEINNHLSILEGLLRNERETVQKKVDEAYQKGYDKGYADKTNNDEVCKNIVKDIQDEAYKRGFEDGKEAIHKGCEGCRHETTRSECCKLCCNNYSNLWQKQDDEIKVGDEVIWTQDENVVIVVTSIYTANDIEWCDGVCKDGKVYHILTKNARKTGRRFGIDKILDEMKE